MADSLSATELRAQLYKVIDEVIATGTPQRVRRGDDSVLIVSEHGGRRLDLTKLPRRTATACTPDELVEQRFAELWRPDL